MNQAKVGVGVIIIRDSKVLLGLRTGSHGANTWSTPGGHLEFGETIADCSIREVLEETNCNLTVLSNHVGWNEKVWEDDKHYITMYTLGTIEGDPVVTEKEKCLGWRWFTSEELEGLELFEDTNMKSILQEALKDKSELQEAVKFLLDNMGKPTPYWPLTESGKHLQLLLSFVDPDWNKIK